MMHVNQHRGHQGDDMGFKYTASGPLVRSSYKAGESSVSLCPCVCVSLCVHVSVCFYVCVCLCVCVV